MNTSPRTTIFDDFVRRRGTPNRYLRPNGPAGMQVQTGDTNLVLKLGEMEYRHQ
jgi:hypothetical protein